MAEKRSIPVQILGQEYRVKSDSDGDVVRRAAALLDETMTRVRRRAGRADTQDIAVLAALNLANQLVTRDPSAGAPTVPQTELRELIQEVEAALAAEPIVAG